MVFALLRTPLHLFGGVVADAWSPLVAVVAFGLLFVGAAAILYLLEPPIVNPQPVETRGSNSQR